MTKPKPKIVRNKKGFSARLDELNQQPGSRRLTVKQGLAKLDFETRLFFLGRLRLSRSQHNRAKFLAMNDLRLAQANSSQIPAGDAVRLLRNSLVIQKLLYPEIDKPRYKQSNPVEVKQEALREWMQTEFQRCKEIPPNHLTLLQQGIHFQLDRLNEEALRQTLGNHRYEIFVKALGKATKLALTEKPGKKPK